MLGAVPIYHIAKQFLILQLNNIACKGVFPMERLFGFRELEERTGVKVPTWRLWAAQRRIPIVRIGRLVKVKESDLMRFIDAGYMPAAREGGRRE